MTYENCLRLEKKYRELGDVKEANFWKERAERKMKKQGVSVELVKVEEKRVEETKHKGKR